MYKPLGRIVNAESHVFYEFFRTFFAGNVDAARERMDMLKELGETDGTERLVLPSSMHNYTIACISSIL